MDTSQQSEYRQSSPDVQVAYNHFRQFRQDLLELSDNLHARIVAEENFIGPGHEAIVLTEPLEDASPESQDSSVDNARSRNNRTLSHPVSLSSPLMATRPPSRRPMAESHLRHTRDLDPDDPNTLLGRRVAARVAASADHQPSQSLDRSLPNPPSENTLFSQQRLGPDELSGNQADTGHNDHSFAHRRTILSSQALFAARAPIQSQSSPETQRPGTEYSARQQTQSDRPDRLSLLSNFSVQNFSTPRSGTLIRPLIFEEPASYVDQDSLQYSSTLDPLVEDEISTRSYIVHRRLNADGEEYVHNINLHWNEDTSSVNANDVHGQQPRISNAAGTDLRDHSVRRRGWARLDPDGNEISVNEEQSERLRATYRTRALQRTRETVAIDENREDCFDEWEELDCNYNARFSSTEALYRRNSSYSGEQGLRLFAPAPFRPSPLPMPLTQMIDCEVSNTGLPENDFVLFLPNTAALAGR